MTENTVRTMRIELKGNSARAAVGEYTETEENGVFLEEYSRADHRLSEDRHERLSAVAWVINGCSGLSARPIELVLIPQENAGELLPLLRGEDPHEDHLLNFEMLGYTPRIKIEPAGFDKKVKRAPAPAQDWYMYYSRLAAELMRLYQTKAGGFSFKLFTGDEYEFENKVREQATQICNALQEKPVCRSEVFCRMFKKIWVLTAEVSREAFNRICRPTDRLHGGDGDICEVSLDSYDQLDLNGSIDFIRERHPEWLLSEEQKTVLRESFVLMGQAAAEKGDDGRCLAAVRAGARTMSLKEGPVALLNRRFGIRREIEVYACIDGGYIPDSFKSGTLITELGIFASVGFPKKDRFISWRQLVDEGIRQENNEYEIWDKQTVVYTRRSTPVTGNIFAFCGELYVLLDEFLKMLEKDGFGR